MRTRNLAAALACIAFAAFGTSPVDAQTTSIDSSIGARCLTADCGTVEFFVELAGNSTVHGLDFLSAGPFGFGSLVAALDGAGKAIEVEWASGVHPSEFNLWFSADSAPEPIRLIVSMVASGTESELHGSITYTGGGLSEEGHAVTFEGSVVPEPAVWLLLLSGLIALAWMARRRQRQGALTPA